MYVFRNRIDTSGKRVITKVISQGHNFYKLKCISLEEVKIVPFQH